MIVMPEFYRKRPVIIEAMRFEGDAVNIHKLYSWIEDSIGSWSVSIDPKTSDIMIETLEGNMIIRYGDWVIRGVKGEMYPCKDDIFRNTYDRVETEVQDEIPDMLEELRPLYTKTMSPYEEMVNAIEQIEMRKKKETSAETD